MSFLDGVLGGQGLQAAAGGPLLGTVCHLLDKAGGVQGLLGLLQQQGLGAAAQSWVSSGANQPVSSEQLGQALHAGGLGATLQEAAGKLGLDQNELLGKLSQALPQAVDHLTPDGQVPAGQTGCDLSMLQGLAGKLLG